MTKIKRKEYKGMKILIESFCLVVEIGIILFILVKTFNLYGWSWEYFMIGFITMSVILYRLNEFGDSRLKQKRNEECEVGFK